ncbi:CPBP family intramembrane metalloprotease [Candidatus Gracilibacteria bacterium]|nr:CPBP family intramembrane metalloprotease [Candidatus Gracilibacteria bacterium]
MILSHLEVVSPKDMKRFKELGVYANFTPHWLGGTVFKGSDVALTTFLVGFSEELVYRGVVFSTFLKDNKVKAILVSAVIFSLLHAVNILAGTDIIVIGAQLFMTFIAGLFFAFVRLKIENIIPIMLYHWAWDFVLIGGEVLKDGDINGTFTTAMIIFQLVFAVTVIPYFVYQERKKVGK